MPGTTRDAIDTRIEYEGLELVLIDTAGIRRRGKIEVGVEKYSFLRSLKAVARADVCLLLIDANDLVTAQDAHIAGYIVEEAKSVVVIVNKWDLVEKDTYTLDEFTARIRADLIRLADAILSPRAPRKGAISSPARAFECVAHFDNSPFNAYNPDPTVTVREGPANHQREMMYGFVFYTETTDLNSAIDPKTEARRSEVRHGGIVAIIRKTRFRSGASANLFSRE